MAKTYADLKADITNWMRRSDLASVIPSFVKMAEQDIFKSNNYPLRVREMETESTLTVTNLTATVPSDFVAARYIKQDNSDRNTLLYETPDKWNQYHTGFFTIVGDEIRLPTGASTNLKFVYFAQPAALVNDTDTNVVLDSYYSIYLSASLKFACGYIKDPNSALTYESQTNKAIVAANFNNKSVIAGPLVVRAT